MISFNRKKYKQQWKQAIPGAPILSKQVHVWCVPLDISGHQRKSMLGLLSTDEVTRVCQLHFEKDQNRFITARGMLRKILGLYLGEEPHRLRFEYTLQGKPLLGSEAGYDGLRFNLSHSGRFALYAITRGQNIGIDIERIRYDISVDQIARRFFSQGEINSLERIHEEMRNELFFQYWTRKEALLKAMGEGLLFPMENCDVSLISGMSFSPVHLSGIKRESSYWYLQDLFPDEGYTAAIAVEGSECDLFCQHYAT